MGSSELTDGPDSIRRFTPEEERQLTENLLGIVRRLEAGELRPRLPDASLLQDFHAALFGGVRGHAGRFRARGFGQEYLTFGPNRSSHRNDVGREVERAFAECQRELRELRELPPSPEGLERGLVLAVVTHAKLVRIHPFEDGNGRSSRLMMSHILTSLGLSRIPMEACKDEYNAVLNRYFASGDAQPLVDLCLRLYPLPEE